MQLCFMLHTHETTRSGIAMQPVPELRALQRSLEMRIVQAQGTQALAPRRKLPLTAEHLLRLRARASGQLIDGAVVDWLEPRWVVFWAAAITAFGAGMRASDALTTAGTPFHAGRLSRASLTWVRVGERLFAHVQAPSSKSDPTGQVWFDHPSHFELRDERDPLDAAACLRALERAVPVAEASAASTPLFVLPPGAGASELTGETFRRILGAMLALVFPPEVARSYSAHSLRAGDATALHCAGASDSEIRTAFRWRSEASQRVYTRIGASESATAAARVLGSSPRALPLAVAVPLSAAETVPSPQPPPAAALPPRVAYGHLLVPFSRPEHTESAPAAQPTAAGAEPRRA